MLILTLNWPTKLISNISWINQTMLAIFILISPGMKSIIPVSQIFIQSAETENEIPIKNAVEFLLHKIISDLWMRLMLSGVVSATAMHEGHTCLLFVIQTPPFSYFYIVTNYCIKLIIRELLILNLCRRAKLESFWYCSWLHTGMAKSSLVSS